MRRTNKLAEALAIVSQLQGQLTTYGLNHLKLDKKTREALRPDVKVAYEALNQIHETLEKLYEEELGVTEKQKWENAAKNLGIKVG